MLTNCGCLANKEQTEILTPCQLHAQWAKAYALQRWGQAYALRDGGLSAQQVTDRMGGPVPFPHDEPDATAGKGAR